MKKNFMKKLLASTLVASMLLGVTGCGSDEGTPSSSTGGNSASGTENQGGSSASGEGVEVFGGYKVTTDDITLTFWHYEDETTVTLLAEKFMEMY